MEGESQEQREKRLKALWYQLDVKRRGYLDLPALKVGLAKMNHRESSPDLKYSHVVACL